MTQEFFDITENLEPEGSDELLENPSNEPVDDELQDDIPADDGNDVEEDGTETGAEYTEVTEHQEKLWAGKYKSPEDMEKAYLSAQRNATKLAQELSALKKQATAPQQGNAQNGQVPADVAQMLQTNPQAALQMLTQRAAHDAIRQYVEPMQDKVDSMTMQSELAKLKATHKDFGEVAPHMAKVFSENPELWKVKDPVKTAYALAKAEYAEEAVAAAKEAGRKEAYQSKESKQKAVVEGQKSKGQQKQKTKEEEMLDNIFSPKGGSVFF